MTVTSAPTRLQLVELAKKLILDEGATFSLTSITKELNCSRSYIRRFFPTKADLIAAAFGEGHQARIDVPKAVRPATRVVKDAGGKDDWIMRRFRIFERAIASLESEIEGVRKENISSVSELEKRLKAQNPGIDVSLTGMCPTQAHSKLEPPPLVSDYGVASRCHPQSIKPASAELDYGYRPQPPSEPREAESELDELDQTRRSHTWEEMDPSFVVAPDFEPDKTNSLRNLVGFGLTAFAAALLIALIVIALTRGAGATYVPHSQPQPEVVASKKAHYQGSNGPVRHQFLIDATGSPSPPRSPASSFGNPGLDNFNIGRITLTEAHRINSDAKVKIALAYLKGDGVAADALLGAAWSYIGAQQGNADAEYTVRRCLFWGSKTRCGKSLSLVFPRSRIW